MTLTIGNPLGPEASRREKFIEHLETVSLFVRYCTYTGIFGLFLMQMIHPRH